MWKQTIQTKIAQQADDKHAVAQNWRHSLCTQRGGQHLHQRDQQHDPGGKSERKRQQAIRGLLPQYAKKRANERGGPRQ
ncbi:hypothetical protein SDC9_194408 [bioreactor metagenome]|uniref:Uncharacterized protein n=1 Tax=bioreactor metagenome TaxID=1076179 RepID=A0A645I8S5_9ZZZZ